jgi:hypothetical protein
VLAGAGAVYGDGADDRAPYLFQSSGDKKRLKTNLDVHLDHVRDSGVIDAIRLAKLWKVRNGLPVRTFVLELAVIKLLEGHKNPSLYEKEKAEVEAHYPGPYFVVESGIVFIRGSFPVMFEGQALDRYP